MKKIRGSYTVEAALVVPLWLMLCLLTVNTGVQFYENCHTLTAEIADMEEIDAIHLFYISQGIGEILEDGDTVH